MKPYGCKCKTIAQKTLGDGCDICNPKLALEYTYETVEDLRARNAELEAQLADIREKAAWYLECKLLCDIYLYWVDKFDHMNDPYDELVDSYEEALRDLRAALGE